MVPKDIKRLLAYNHPEQKTVLHSFKLLVTTEIR